MQPTDEIFARQAISGDKGAFGKLVQRYQNTVYGVAYHFTRNASDAQDLTQEAFLQAYLKLDQLKEPAKFAHWLHRITENVCKMWLRRAEPEMLSWEALQSPQNLTDELQALASERPAPLDRETTSFPTASSVEAACEAQELQRAIQRSMETLSEKNRLAVTLYYLVKGFPFDDRAQVKGWTEVTRYVRQIDPFHRPISIHPTGLGRLSARGATEDVSLLDFDMLQTGHGGREVLSPTIQTLRWSYAQQPTMPVLNSEVAYEALLDRIPAEIQRLMFWSCLLSGAAGHTYGANGIWQVNRVGQPHGASPHGGNYGSIPWDEAMHLPGSGQLALGKALLEQYPWHRFEPHPEWASFTSENSSGHSEFEVPYAAGIPGVVRIIYAPRNEPVVLRDLERKTPFAAIAFDPVSGEKTAIGTVDADASGAWTCPPPAGNESDWVLILEMS